MGLIDRLRSVVGRGGDSIPPVAALETPPLLYSWVLSGRLAVGPMPQSVQQWQQLDAAGFRSRFSCCYPDEERQSFPPKSWLQARVSLPDHRLQEDLKLEQLRSAIEQASELLHQAPAMYLHCLAGMERSPLVAVGIVAKEKNIDLLSALDAIRMCHPPAKPMYEHLDVLDQLIRAR